MEALLEKVTASISLHWKKLDDSGDREATGLSCCRELY